MNVRTTVEKNPDGYQVEYGYFDPHPDFLERLLRDLFENHWKEITFGPCIQGAVFEIKAVGPPRHIGMLDGYLTVDFGDWHFHLCIGPHRGTPKNPTPRQLARWRQVSRAAFFRYLNREGAPTAWGIRLWNGKGEQMISFFLPNPYHGEDGGFGPPDWSKLALWNRLRETHLGLPPHGPGPETAKDPHE
ncbi:MAG: hypothetical protein ACE5H3_09135 [Planctomycetota bacterium]